MLRPLFLFGAALKDARGHRKYRSSPVFRLIPGVLAGAVDEQPGYGPDIAPSGREGFCEQFNFNECRGDEVMTDLAQTMGKAVKAMADKEGKYLTFMMAGEEYGIEILKIKEIIGMLPVTTVPQTPDFVKGVINLL